MEGAWTPLGCDVFRCAASPAAPPGHLPRGRQRERIDDVWNLVGARRLAGELLGDLGNRWLHVQTAGRLAEELYASNAVSEVIPIAAWLHDVGYATAVTRSGFHSLDGAWHLQRLGAPEGLVALVARHTGAEVEAEERGLLAHLEAMPAADPDDLDALTLVDLVSGPRGGSMRPEDRLAEIRERYRSDSPVGRAIARSGPGLLATAQRARVRLSVADQWPGPSV